VSGVPSQGTYFLGRYRIIDEIGLGGMASVHLARVDGLGGFQRWFAIKRIHAHLVEDETFVNMFLDEANVAARISHPNVATVFELGKHDDTYWIAMEYLHGEPLREVMRRTEEMGATMPPEIACRVIAEAADGLHAAHELQGKDGEKLNLIHRDVTPHNLFVTYEGVTKVVDFGIAKFQDRMASTQAGTLKGKLAYMSPEQVQGEAIDRRTDIFALGVVLWELTTGQRLFRMDSDLDTLAKVQECNIPPPSTMVRGYPLDLEKIVMQALAKNRNDRFPTAREFSRALQSLLTRRGLFIASDEVAAYMASIFVDRIAKREEHLRWASAVSDAAAAAAAMQQSPPDAPAARPVSPAPAVRNSVPQPLAGPAPKGAPRPAAGAPARPPAYGASGPSSMTASEQRSLGRPATMPLVMPGKNPPSSRGSTFPPPPPRGGASYPLPRPSKAPPPPAPPQEDDEERTVQATAAQQAAAYAGYDNDDDDDNDATIVSRAAPSDTVPPSGAYRPLGSPILPAAGMPAMPRDRGPLPSFPAAPPPPTPPPPAMRSAGPANARTMPLNAVAPSGIPGRSAPIPPQQRTQLGMQAPPPAPPPQAYADRGVPANFNITDPSLPDNVGAPTIPPAPMQQSWAPQGALPAYGPPPQFGQGQGGPSYAPPGGQPFPPPPQYAPNGGMPPQQQFVPQGYGGPPGPQAPSNIGYAQQPAPPDPKGLTRQGIRPKRIPAWVVAVASGLVALVIAGAVVLVFAITRHKSDAQAHGGAASAGSSGGGTGSTILAGGLFSTARAGFLAAATPPPLTANQPTDAPADSTAAAAAAPPSATADAGAAVAAATPPPPADPPPAAAPATPDPPPPPPVAARAPRQADPTPAAQPEQAPAPIAHYQPPAAPAAAGGAAATAKGFLSVICLPGCDRVELDGQALGPAPIFKHATPVGSHRIRLTSSNPPASKTVSKIVLAGTTAVVRESMP
jgi:tRNA A-37 threonylcarbamoyl transferase component Bud32